MHQNGTSEQQDYWAAAQAVRHSTDAGRRQDAYATLLHLIFFAESGTVRDAARSALAGQGVATRRAPTNTLIRMDQHACDPRGR